MNFQNLASQFLTRAFSELDRQQFHLEENWHIDHLCYRTASEQNYLERKKEFEGFSILLTESEVNGRMISTFKLPRPLYFQDWQVDLIELPAPKKGKITPEGFEHFEVVCDLTFDELKARYNKFKVDEAGLKKDFNQELEFEFDDFAVKFHHLSLESVIRLERNSSVFTALQSSRALSALKEFHPLVAGTFPLGLQVEGSDIDLLISGPDLSKIKDTLVKQFGNSPKFILKEFELKGEPTVLAKFEWDEVKFEIFAQKTESVHQSGYRHFLIEERLLKVGGLEFFTKVMSARKEGLKTEPAFVRVLGFSGDPYKELLNLQKQSNAELARLPVSPGF